jgi:hypothetical protein
MGNNAFVESPENTLGRVLPPQNPVSKKQNKVG